MGYGDELIATFQARELKRACPGHQIVVLPPKGRTGWSRHQREVFRNNPHITAPEDVDPFLPLVRLVNRPGERPYIRAWEDERVLFTDFRVGPGDVCFDSVELERVERWRERVGDALVLAPTVKRALIARNKDWEYGGELPGRWQRLAELLSREFRLVELAPPDTDRPPLAGVPRVVSRTFREACEILAACRGLVTTEGGLHHAAAALGKPAVVVFGGRTAPFTTGYDAHENLYVATNGSPCGRITDCGHCRSCMAAIGIDDVAAAARRRFAGAPPSAPRAPAASRPPAPDLDADSAPLRSPEVRCQDERDGVLIRAPGGDFRLNGPAARIWRLCDGARTLAEIRGRLEREHGLGEGDLAADVRGAAQALLAIGALRLVERRELDLAALGVDWSRVAEPQEDLSDLRAAFDVYEARYGPRPGSPATDNGRAVLHFGGRVAACVAADELETELVPAPFDHPNLALAEAWLDRWPLGKRIVQETFHSLQPFLDPAQHDDERAFLGGSRCHSSDQPAKLGAMWSTINCPLMLAENLLHEAAHQKLFALGILKEATRGWIANSQQEGYASPVLRNRPRPMTAMVHGAYAYLYVTQFDVHVLAAEPAGPRRERIRARLSTNQDRVDAALAEIGGSLRTDAAGERFFAGFRSWSERLRRDVRAALSAPSPRGNARPAVEVGPEPVRIFVGSDPRMHAAELALEHSIRSRTRGPVRIHWMDHSLGGVWSGWAIGRERGRLPVAPQPKAWATEFTCFRFAIPEVAGFRGRALYLDSDMLALEDLRELFEHPLDRPVLRTPNCMATMLFDCAWFADKDWWPRLARMRRSGWNLGAYCALLEEHGALGTLPAKWNRYDDADFDALDRGILHFTHRATQPWHPYPEIFGRRPHPRGDLRELWEREHAAALRALRQGSRPAAPDATLGRDRP